MTEKKKKNLQYPLQQTAMISLPTKIYCLYKISPSCV